ncbi:MAG: MFS transporter [Pseudomonadota bacterium]
MLIVFGVILLDLIGFGIMVPILAYYVIQLGGTPELATLCMALYPLGMLISTPVLGRLSDYYGRRPILMISMAGAVLGYTLLGFANSVWIVALSRLVSGLMSGNIAAAQAYMTDITTEKDRARAMGLIGAAFGLGFIVGPVLGAFLAGDDFSQVNLVAPALVSAALSGAAFFAILIFLPESLDRAHRDELRARPRPAQMDSLRGLWARPLLPYFLVGALIYDVGNALVHAIYPLWVAESGIAAGPTQLMPLLLVGGIALAIAQGGCVGPMARTLGEHRMFQLGCIVYACAMLFTTWAGVNGSYYGAMVALSIQSFATAMIMPSMQSLVSQRAGPTERGMVLGIYASAGTLGRVIGTSLTGVIFAWVDIQSPFIVCAAMMFILYFLARSIQKQWQEHHAEPPVIPA